MRDLFGEAPDQPMPGTRRGPKGGKNYVRQRGYAAMPGTGPAGETCATCKNCARFRKWAKCRLIERKWTGGRATDVLMRSPACSRWERRDVE